MTVTRKYLIALAAGMACALIPATSFADAPGTIEFKANNQLYDAQGKFEDWHFTRITIPDGNLEKGVVEFEINLASVWEKTEALAEHLRQADFFHVENFATATIKIDRVKKTGDSSYEGVATVDFHGHVNEVPVTFDVVGTSPLKIEGQATLQRTAFGIGGEYDPENERSIVDDIAISISATVAQ